MKYSSLLLSTLLIAVLGGAGLFYAQSILPDNELISRDVNAQLLKIDSLDANINELALRNRVSLDLDYDMLVRSTAALEQAVSVLASTYFTQENIKGSLLETRFNNFRAAIEVKTDQLEDFKSANSVLRNSEKYAPLVGTQLAQAAQQNELPKVGDFYKQVVLDVLDFTRVGSTKSKRDFIEYAQQIRDTETKMPANNAIQILEFANHVDTAINSKSDTDQYLNKVLNSTLDDQISDISAAWHLLETEKDLAQEKLRYYTIAYVLGILILLGLMMAKLRSLYSNLDREVEQKTMDVKKAYEELYVSVQKLGQSEKMASLGQLVAGVAHEINTPLSYISSNVSTIQARLCHLSPVLNIAEAISEKAKDKNRDKNALNALFKEQISEYRKIKKDSMPANLGLLLSDASEGLEEIQQTVNSLTNFSHVESAQTESVDINGRLKSALKVSSMVLGDRIVVTHFSSQNIVIEGISNQLTQVFTNIITNAAHATDPSTGAITIETELQNTTAVITFTDNGHGIDKEILKRVMEPFFTTKDVGEGTGLGLSIAHSIVKAHDGDIVINSDADTGGATVTVTLPVVPA